MLNTFNTAMILYAFINFYKHLIRQLMKHFTLTIATVCTVDTCSTRHSVVILVVKYTCTLHIIYII